MSEGVVGRPNITWELFVIFYILAHQEQQALIERLEDLKRTLDCEQNKLERSRREAHARAEQDRNYANQLKDEMAALKTRLEELKYVAYYDMLRFKLRYTFHNRRMWNFKNPNPYIIK